MLRQTIWTRFMEVEPIAIALRNGWPICCCNHSQLCRAKLGGLPVLFVPGVEYF